MNALLLLLAQAAAPAASPPIAATPVGDPVLAEQRGGFRLPSGVDVALTVQTQTALNGAVVLRTVFQIDQGAPTLTIYAPAAGQTVAAGSAGGGEREVAPAAAPTITYDHSAGLIVTPAAPQSTISVSTGAPATQALPTGLTAVAAGAATDAGVVSDTTRDGLRTVSLSGADLTITHLAGTAFGSAVANSGSDRAIDTQTDVSVALGNAGPDVVGSAMFKVQDLALDAATARGN